MNKITEALKPTMQYVNGKEGLTYHCWVAYRPLDAIDDLEKYIAGQTQASFVYEDQAKWFCKQFNDAIAQGLEPFEETSGGGFESRLASPKSALKLAEEALEYARSSSQNQEMWGYFNKALQGLYAIRQVLAEPVNEICQPDSNCVEADGCPTELAVLQRFWREQKAEPVKQEPVGFVTQKLMPGFGWRKDVVFIKHVEVGTDLYAAPVRTKDLTDDEIDEIESKILMAGGEHNDIYRAVIAADREKNK